MKSKNSGLCSNMAFCPILRHSRCRMVLLICLIITGKVFAQPTITSFSPASAAIGSTVTITGTGFNATAANNVVYFTGVKATITSASATSLTVTVPTGALYGPISVLNKGTVLQGTSTKPFLPAFNNSCPTAWSAASFAARQDFSTSGVYPQPVIVGDIDGDGRLDLIAGNFTDLSISVMRNTSSIGSVSFATRQDFSAGNGILAVGMADLDNDGRLDLMSLNSSSNNMSVLRNLSSSGTVSLAGFVNFATGSSPRSIAFADVDADGKTDVIVGNASSNTISVLRNTSSAIGSITFATKVDLATSTSPTSVAVADIDGDGKTDIVAANGQYLSVYRNISAGAGSVSFNARIDFTAGNTSRGLVLGDMDGDGKPDMAAASNTSATMSVLRNTSSSGSISFTAKTDYATGAAPINAVINDMDGDGLPDIAVINSTDNTVSLLRNTSTASGAISLAGKVDYSTLSTLVGLTSGDMDGDSRPDLVVADGSLYLSVFRNTITATSLSGIASANTTSNAVCDNGLWKKLYNSTGKTVVAAIKDNGQNLGTSTATVYVDAQPGALPSGRPYMASHFKIGVTTQPSSAVKVRLYFTDASLQALAAVDPTVQSIADLNVTKYSGSNEDGTPDFSGGTLVFIPKTSITTGQELGANYIEFSVTSFSEFWIHGGSSALPVELTSFSAAKSSNGVLLRWTTAQEQNADRFIVERSSDGVTYAGIGSVAASGTTTQQHSYSYTDAAPANGLSYYRLQQVDLDGHRETSKVLGVRWGKAAELAVTIRYTGTRQVQVHIDGQVNNGRLELYDGAGRQLKSYPVSTGGGAGAQLDLDLGAFSAGIYMYRLMTSDGRVSSGKIMLH